MSAPAWPEWRDIASAPRDGTRVIITNGGWVVAAYWSDSIWAKVSSDLTLAAGGGWVQEENRSDTYCFEGATHWLPLPPPPKERA